MRFVAIDFETANNDPTSVCAIGLAFVRKGKVQETFHQLIRPPTRRFSPFNVELHGISWEDVRSEPDFREVWRDLRDRIADDVLVAHSAGFERRVFTACSAAFRMRPPSNDFVCTVRLARRVLGFRRANLPRVCRVLGIPLLHHYAESDANAAAMIALRAARKADVRTVRSLARLCV